MNDTFRSETFTEVINLKEGLAVLGTYCNGDWRWSVHHKGQPTIDFPSYFRAKTHANAVQDDILRKAANKENKC